MGARVVQIEINCGEKTCASQPGEFCKYLGTTRFGTIYVCILFPSEAGAYTVLEDADGWLQRCPACLEAEGNWLSSQKLGAKCR